MDGSGKTEIIIRRGDGKTRIEVPRGTRMMISNACFCDETSDLVTHFAVVEGGDRPKLVDFLKPDHEDPFDIRCACGFVEFD